MNRTLDTFFILHGSKYDFVNKSESQKTWSYDKLIVTSSCSAIASYSCVSDLDRKKRYPKAVILKSYFCRASYIIVSYSFLEKVEKWAEFFLNSFNLQCFSTKNQSVRPISRMYVKHFLVSVEQVYVIVLSNFG